MKIMKIEKPLASVGRYLANALFTDHTLLVLLEVKCHIDILESLKVSKYNLKIEHLLLKLKFAML